MQIEVAGQIIDVTPAQAEKMKGHKWAINGKQISARIDGRYISLTRFLYDVYDPRIQPRRRTMRPDFRPQNIKFWDTVNGCEVSNPNTTAAVEAIHPTPIVLPELGNDVPIRRPMFIDVDGRGMIVNVGAIARIDLTDADIVEVELMLQQFPETGRDTKPISYAYDGKQAEYVRLWAMDLSDQTGRKLIEMVIQLQADNERLRNVAQPKPDTSQFDRLVAKLSAIGFDANKLLEGK